MEVVGYGTGAPVFPKTLYPVMST